MTPTRLYLALAVLVAVAAVSATESQTQMRVQLTQDLHHFVDKNWTETYHALISGVPVMLKLNHVAGTRHVFSGEWTEGDETTPLTKVDVLDDHLNVFIGDAKIPLYYYGMRGLRCGSPTYLKTKLFQGAVMWPHVRHEESKGDETTTSINRNVRYVRELVDLFTYALQKSLMGVSLRSIDTVRKEHDTAAQYVSIALEAEASLMSSILRPGHAYISDLSSLAKALPLQFNDLTDWAERMQLSDDDITPPPQFDWDGTREVRFGLGNLDLAEPIGEYRKAEEERTVYTLSDKHAAALRKGLRKGVEKATAPFLAQMDEQIKAERGERLPGNDFFPTMRERQLMAAKQHLSKDVVNDLTARVFDALLESDLSGTMLTAVDDFVIGSMERATGLYDRIRGHNKKAENGVRARSGLRPGEDGVVKSMHTTALEGEKTRTVKAQEQAEGDLKAKAAATRKEGRMVVPFEVKNKFKPKIKVSGLAVKSISVRNTLEFGNEHFRSILSVDVTLKDPFSSDATAQAVIKSETSIGNWKFGGHVTTDVEGVYHAGDVKTVVVNSFVTYKEGSTSAGLFLSYVAVGDSESRGQFNIKSWYNTRLTDKISWANQFDFQQGGSEIAVPGSKDMWSASSAFTVDFSQSLQLRTGVYLSDNQDRFNTSLRTTLTYETADDLFIGAYATYGRDDFHQSGAGSRDNYAVGVTLQWRF